MMYIVGRWLPLYRRPNNFTASAKCTAVPATLTPADVCVPASSWRVPTMIAAVFALYKNHVDTASEQSTIQITKRFRDDWEVVSILMILNWMSDMQQVPTPTWWSSFDTWCISILFIAQFIWAGCTKIQDGVAGRRPSGEFFKRQ